MKSEKKPTVSVIVPVYKVEPYIRQCLDSVVAQSYENLEIILVDDGSPDRCGVICDEYAAKDRRIKVIHQANRGVAAARNTGLRAATGEWIAWADSDDWVSEGFIEYLLTNALRYDADITICGKYEEHGDWQNLSSPGQRILDSEAGIAELLIDEKIHNYAWDKLCRAELYKGLAYPEGHLFEDVALCWQLIDRAERIVCCPDGHYHYRIREDGITKSAGELSTVLFYPFRFERFEALAPKYPRLREALENDCRCAVLNLWRSYYMFGREERRARRAQFSEASAFIRQHPPGHAFLNRCGKAERLVLRLAAHDAAWSLALAGCVNKLYYLKNGSDINKWSDKTMPTEIKAKMNNSILNPAFPDCPEAIVFSANDYYCPYLSVMLYSVLEHASPSRKYDIVILHRDISPENQNQLRSMGAGRDNVSIRFLNVAALIENFSLYTGGKQEFTVDAYLRFLIPDVLALSYQKALYLDSDMLALTDVGELLNTNLEGFLLASSRDMNGLASYYDPMDNARKRYRDKVLKLKRPDDYFIDGMLVLNLDAFRAEYSSQKLLELAASRDWLQHDQDVLNLICDGGRAKLLDAAWDALKPYKPELLPPLCRAELEESLKDPKIVHFGGDEKPWRNTESPWMDQFWDTAVKTPYYKEMIYRILDSRDEQLQYDLDCVRNSVSFRIGRAITWVPRKLRGGVRCLKEHGIDYTFRRTLYHLGLKEWSTE